MKPLSILVILCAALSLNASTLISAAALETKLTAPDAQQGDQFGRAVAVQGNIAVVGAPEVANGAGAAYVYQRNGQSGWSLLEKLFASDAAQNDAFGCAVAVSNNTVLVGALGKSDVAPNAGAAYIYEF